MINTKLILTAVIFFILGVIVTSLLTKNQYESLKSQDKPKSSNSSRDETASLANTSDCQFRKSIPDTTGDGVEETITICKNKLVMKPSGPDGYEEVFETDESFPDLFWNKNLGRDFRLPQTIEINQKSNLGLLLIIRTSECPGTWCTKGTGLYLIKANKIKRIFQLKDDAPSGRTGYMIIVSTNPLVIRTYFDIGYIGGLGNRYYWSNFYEWNFNKKELVLSNNTHINDFRKLLAEYEQFEKDPCSVSYYKSKMPNLSNETISSLYEKRKNFKKLCPNQEDDPVSPDVMSAKLFIDSKKTILNIISGKNYSHEDIKIEE